MSRDRFVPSAYRYPFPPFPNGWFCVAESDEIAGEKVRALHFFGRELVAFRGADGRVRVLDAFCPHLGAHLGVGGRVEGNTIRCPFHAWRYDGDSGRCVEIPYAKKIPAKARLRSWDVLEWCGFVIVYHHARGEPPTWTPDLPGCDAEEWRVHGRRHWKVRTHVQEIGENGLDLAHVQYVHDSEKLELVRAEEQGPILVFDSRPPPNSPNARFVRVIRRILWGMGLSMNEFKGKVESRVIITRTPIDEEFVDVRMAFLPRCYPDPNITEALGEALMGRVSAEFEGDIAIWENKAYMDRPLLCDGDGPVSMWRRWSRQFYSEEEGSTSARFLTSAQ